MKLSLKHTGPSHETGSETCSMVESFSVIRSMLATILPFSSSLPPSPPFPFLHYLYHALSFLSTPTHFSLSHSFPLSFPSLPFPSLLSPQDPVRFLPSIGYLSTYREPTGQPGLEKVPCKNKQVVRRQHPQSCSRLSLLQVRVDTGIVEGSTISMYYDPMISKVPEL